MKLVELLARLDKVRSLDSDRFIARCPAHPDDEPSLSIAQGNETILVYCWAGCETADVMASLGLSMRDLWEDVGQPTRAPLNGRRLPQWRALRQEMDILLMCADRREESASSEFRRRYPALVDPKPEETFDREREAARRVKKLIERIYDV